MKAVIALTLFAGLTAQAKLPVIEETILSCGVFATNSQVFLGKTAPKIVRFPYDSTGGTAFYVKTSVVYPGATPSYDKLEVVSSDNQGAVLESETFLVVTKADGTGAIALRASPDTVATCSLP